MEKIKLPKEKSIRVSIPVHGWLNMVRGILAKQQKRYFSMDDTLRSLKKRIEILEEKEGKNGKT